MGNPIGKKAIYAMRYPRVQLLNSLRQSRTAVGVVSAVLLKEFVEIAVENLSQCDQHIHGGVVIAIFNLTKDAGCHRDPHQLKLCNDLSCF